MSITSWDLSFCGRLRVYPASHWPSLKWQCQRDLAQVPADWKVQAIRTCLNRASGVTVRGDVTPISRLELCIANRDIALSARVYSLYKPL